MVADTTETILFYILAAEDLRTFPWFEKFEWF